MESPDKHTYSVYKIHDERKIPFHIAEHKYIQSVSLFKKFLQYISLKIYDYLFIFSCYILMILTHLFSFYIIEYNDFL